MKTVHKIIKWISEFVKKLLFGKDLEHQGAIMANVNDWNVSNCYFYKYFPTYPHTIIGNGTSKIYFSLNSYDSALRAKYFLAVPYEPLCRVKIESNINPHDLIEKFEDRRGSVGIRRTWAAFGLIGGGYEFVTSRIFVSSDMPEEEVETDTSGLWVLDRILDTGGTYDEYSSFVEQTEHGFIQSLFIIFFGNMGQRFEVSDWKVLDDQPGGVFYWRTEEYEYSISILIKKREDIYNGIKLWGAIWKDYTRKSGTIRKIYKSVEVLVPGYPILKQEEMDDEDQREDFQNIVVRQFYNIRDILHEKSELISVDKLTEWDVRKLPPLVEQEWRDLVI